MTASLYDSPDLYDALLPASSGQLQYYLKLARGCAGGILELACGSGQLLIPIAATGLTATGLDQSAQMLLAANRRAESCGTHPRFVQADMRDFDLGQRFSVIFISRNSLLHLHELQEFESFFAAVRRHLEPNGVLAFDIFNTNLKLLSRRRGERFHVMHKTSTLHGQLTVEATNDYDCQAQINRATWFVSTPAQPDAWVFPLHLRCIFPQELLALLSLNGIRLMRRDGDFHGGDFASSSPNQVCQCQSA